MKKLNVVFAIDQNFIQHFTVACTSLLEHNIDIIERILLIHDVKDDKRLEKSYLYFQEKYFMKIEEYHLNSSLFDKFKISHHISKAAYFRLLMPEILPNDLRYVMYLDSDIIISGNLGNILNMNFSKDTYKSEELFEYYLYAVDHKFNSEELERINKIGLKGNKYFNSGVMYINLKKWRDDQISNKLIENAVKYNERLKYWDQDVLNLTFDLKWAELPCAYNVFFGDEIEENSKVIHYITGSKPWHFNNTHPYKHLYWKYLRMTPFKYYIPEDFTLKNIVKKFKRKTRNKNKFAQNQVY